MRFAALALLSAVFGSVSAYAAADTLRVRQTTNNTCLERRLLGLESIPQIMTNATNALQAGPLGGIAVLTWMNATPFAVNTDLVNINSILTDALNKTVLLDGQPLEVILLAVDEIVVDSINDTAEIVAALVSAVITTLANVEAGGICLTQELQTIDLTLASLLNATTTLVAQLLSILTSLTEALLPDLSNLGMPNTQSALGLSS